MDVRVEIPVAWGEMDSYGHVNNAVFLRWFETARIAWFEHVDFPDEPGKIGPVVRAASVEYHRTVTYPDTVRVVARPTKMGRSSVVLAYEITSAKEHGAVVASGETTVVLIDIEASKSLELPPEARARIEACIAQGKDA
jgi:acyl-CoA thioester hydrolase